MLRVSRSVVVIALRAEVGKDRPTFSINSGVWIETGSDDAWEK